MDYFLKLFGSVTIEWLVLAIAGIIFLWKIYCTVRDYFSKKAIAEKEKTDQLQEVIDQAKEYPKWHQQSIDIRVELTNAIEDLKADLTKIAKTNDEWHADDMRAYILRFNMELVREVRHTREDFIEVLTKIDAYEHYCAEHDEYKNNRAVSAIANIKRVYEDRLRKHDFL